MMSFLGAVSYVEAAEDVQWTRMGPYKRSGGPCLKGRSLFTGSFVDDLRSGIYRDFLKQTSFQDEPCHNRNTSARFNLGST